MYADGLENARAAGDFLVMVTRSRDVSIPHFVLVERIKFLAHQYRLDMGNFYTIDIVGISGLG
jgi:hypothetical protein